MTEKDNNLTVVNIAYGSVIGIQCPGDVIDSTVVVDGTTVISGNKSGRWIDPEQMDRSMISDPNDLDQDKGSNV